ncbi:MAG: transcriptional repressor LexA [Deltaproteobacteria bacterium]|nr:transcriptional repressor LexA [Deltaproteobacteria bacterium]
MFRGVKLTLKQEKLLKFIQDYALTHGKPPALREVAIFLRVKYPSTARFHIKALEKKKILKFERGRLEFDFPEQKSVRFYGYISAGKPIITAEYQAFMEIPDFFLAGLPSNKVYLLRVKGDSMIEENMLDGDFLIVRSDVEPLDGDTVVATLDSESTVKKFYRYKDKVVLKPANKNYESIIVSGERLQKLMIQGVVIGLFRQYNFRK